MKKKILTTIILIMFCTLASCQCVKAETETEIKTTIQIKNGVTRWTNITVSDAYDKCQELNKKGGALGDINPDNVMAHLSTNADWFAVSLLTCSDYGASLNSTGIGFSYYEGCHVSALREDLIGTDTKNYQSLIDNKNTKFVERLKVVRSENKPGLGLLDFENFTSARVSYESISEHPTAIRSGLFDAAVGGWGQDGSGNVETGFRPVIWVK